MNTQLIKKIETGVPKLKRKIKHNVWKMKLVAVLLGVGLALVVIYMAFLRIADWFDTYQVVRQQFVKIQLPVIIKKREMFTPLGKNKKPISKPLYEDEEFLENVYELTRFYESGRGTNGNSDSTHGYCQQQGLVNEIGYLPNGNRKFCFKSYTEQRTTFTKWLAKRLKKGYTLKEAICEYVTGTRQPMCNRTIDMGL